MNQIGTGHIVKQSVHSQGEASPASLVQTLIIEGAGCASCVTKIENALNALPDVKSAEMNFADRTVSVTGDASIEQLIKAVENAGYNASVTAGLTDAESLV